MKLVNELSTRLLSSDAVAAIILLDDGKYLLQHRDNTPGIWYPDHWGCFGGAIDDDETPLEALKRELHEEIELDLHDAIYFTQLDFDLTELGMRRFHRIYYVIAITPEEHTRLILHEGQAVDAFPCEMILNKLRVAPYDAFALFLHSVRHRLGDSRLMGRTK